MTDPGLEAPADDAVNARLDVVHHTRHAGWSDVTVGVDALGQLVSGEGFLPAEQLVQNQAQGIDVAGRSDLVAGELFGRHVCRGA